MPMSSSRRSFVRLVAHLRVMHGEW
ncbi:MAG: hypothetical protein QOJ75_2070, partial [Chloroflexota bacterium]|nr:hypothetical protein [Chloroflexota bacterium]